MMRALLAAKVLRISDHVIAPASTKSSEAAFDRVQIAADAVDRIEGSFKLGVAIPI